MWARLAISSLAVLALVVYTIPEPQPEIDIEAIKDAAYSEGVKAGIVQAEKNMPKQCMAWWFQGEKTADRTKEIKHAYCKKGKNGT